MLHTLFDARSPALSVAGLRLVFDVVDDRVSVTLPARCARFQAEGGESELRLAVRLGSLSNPHGWRLLCDASEGWRLWQDAAGRYVFGGQDSGLARQVTVDAGFRTGEVLVEPATSGLLQTSSYPLAGIDAVFFANWLANSGDLILHASGVEFEGRAYCFIGCSGAGKSTMAVAFRDAGLKVLGEDNLVLRCVDGCFRVFGTPWHQDPALCCPGGAPLEKVFFLDRTVSPRIRACPPVAGVARLLQTAFVPYYREDAVGRIVENLGRLSTDVLFRDLSYRLGSDLMELVRA